MLPAPDAVPEALQPSARLCDVLSSVGRPRPWLEREPRVVEPLPDAWGRAAVFARTAQDLLTTYWDPGGAQRSPASERLEDAEARLAGVGQIADHAGLLADAASTLALKAVQAGVPTHQAMLLDEGGQALRRAVDEHRLDPRRAGRASEQLADLEVARPAVRSDDPLTELGDRVARLHRYAWQLTTEPHAGVATLTNYAAAGSLITKATGRQLQHATAQPDSPVASGWAAPVLDQLDHAAAGWYTIYRNLARLRSLTPGAPGVRADVTRIRDILGGLPPDDVPARSGLGVLLAASQAFGGDVAPWNAHVLEHRLAAADLLLPGRDLPRDFLSEDHELAQGRLSARFVAAPPSIVLEMARMYRHLQIVPGRPAPSTTGTKRLLVHPPPNASPS
jgi:hypothetical protein